MSVLTVGFLFWGTNRGTNQVFIALKFGLSLHNQLAFAIG